MKKVFRNATIDDKKDIYEIWKQTKQRLLGIDESIKNNFIYVFECDEKIIGFCRFNLFEGKTLDYLKFNEIYLDIKINDDKKNILLKNILLLKFFFNNIEKIIWEYGFVKGKVNVTNNNEIFFDQCVFSNWEYDHTKFTISNSKVFHNKIYQIKIAASENNIKKFGVRLCQEKF